MSFPVEAAGPLGPCDSLSVAGSYESFAGMSNGSGYVLAPPSGLESLRALYGDGCPVELVSSYYAAYQSYCATVAATVRGLESKLPPSSGASAASGSSGSSLGLSPTKAKSSKRAAAWRAAVMPPVPESFPVGFCYGRFFKPVARVSVGNALTVWPKVGHVLHQPADTFVTPCLLDELRLVKVERGYHVAEPTELEEGRMSWSAMDALAGLASRTEFPEGTVGKLMKRDKRARSDPASLALLSFEDRLGGDSSRRPVPALGPWSTSRGLMVTGSGMRALHPEDPKVSCVLMHVDDELIAELSRTFDENEDRRYVVGVEGADLYVSDVGDRVARASGFRFEGSLEDFRTSRCELSCDPKQVGGVTVSVAMSASNAAFTGSGQRLAEVSRKGYDMAKPWTDMISQEADAMVHPYLDCPVDIGRRSDVVSARLEGNGLAAIVYLTRGGPVPRLLGFVPASPKDAKADLVVRTMEFTDANMGRAYAYRLNYEGEVGASLGKVFDTWTMGIFKGLTKFGTAVTESFGAYCLRTGLAVDPGPASASGSGGFSGTESVPAAEPGACRYCVIEKAHAVKNGPLGVSCWARARGGAAGSAELWLGYELRQGCGAHKLTRVAKADAVGHKEVRVAARCFVRGTLAPEGDLTRLERTKVRVRCLAECTAPQFAVEYSVRGCRPWVGLNACGVETCAEHAESLASE